MSLISDSSKLVLFLLRWSKGIRHVRLVMVSVILLGALSGAASTGLLALVNSTLKGGGELGDRLVLVFVILCVALPVSRLLSGALLMRLTVVAARELRYRLCRGVLSAPLRRLEELGPHRALAVLSEDVPAITHALTSFPTLCMQVFIVAGSLLYLGWLSWKVLLLVLGFMVVGIVTYQLPMLWAMRFYRRMRGYMDTMMKDFRAVTDGSKELRLNRRRRAAFLAQELEPTLAGVRETSFAANTIALGAVSWGQVLFFVLIGAVLFLMPDAQGREREVMIGYSLVILYMMTPLESILNTLPTLSQAVVSIEAADRLGLALAQGEAPEALAASAAAEPSFQRLDLVGVTHSYQREGEAGTFSMGPIDLTFVPGEIVFIVGGNGSGKTTLAKLITGLYLPESGEIRVDGRTVGEAGREEYRQLFSAVFTDFFLFEKFLGLESPELDSQARQMLHRLRLQHKVEVRDGALSTIELSQGQRKRLALLTAWLEDRPIYLFDEWAADQDSLFKEIFYLQLLPALKAAGKAVLVISHDDRYYDAADRIVKLEYGQVEFDRLASGEPAGQDLVAL